MLQKWQEPNCQGQGCPLNHITKEPLGYHLGPSTMIRDKGVPEKLNGLPTVMGLWENQREGGSEGGRRDGKLAVSPGGYEACHLLP